MLTTLTIGLVISLSGFSDAQVLDLSQPVPQKVTPSIPNVDNMKKQQPMVLKGSIKTLDAAIREERDTVDWYRWYLQAREYLSRTGGFQCAIGTPIIFHKDGVIEPQSYSMLCLRSAAMKRFPLPKDTALSAVILPVRPGQGPPASPEELERRIRESSETMNRTF